MLTSRHVLVVKFQGGKQIRHLLLVKMLHPIKGRRKLQRSYGGSFLKPRLQRLFLSPNLASSMKWHVNSRTDDGVMRHLADLDAWKMFDSKHLEFSSNPRNVKLGLAADGFNPSEL